MALPLLTLPRMFATLGISVATVQKDSLNQAQLSALFWLTNVFSVIAAGVTILLGWARWFPSGSVQVIDFIWKRLDKNIEKKFGKKAGVSLNPKTAIEKSIIASIIIKIYLLKEL